MLPLFCAGAVFHSNYSLVLRKVPSSNVFAPAVHYPIESSCKISFHLVPMILLVRIRNIRDQAEVENSKFSDSYQLALDSIPPATSIGCAHTSVHIQLHHFSRGLCGLALLFIFDKTKHCLVLTVHLITSGEC